MIDEQGKNSLGVVNMRYWFQTMESEEKPISVVDIESVDELPQRLESLPIEPTRDKFSSPYPIFQDTQESQDSSEYIK